MDTVNDPHNSKRGFWFSHIGWIFEKRGYPKGNLISTRDIEQDTGIHKLVQPFLIFCSCEISTSMVSISGCPTMLRLPLCFLLVVFR